MFSRPHLSRRNAVAGVLLACVAMALGLFFLLRPKFTATPAAMVAALPQTSATLVYLDMNALRSTGLLDVIAGSKTVREDPEYQSFVSATGFSYQRDLQAVAASFSSTSAFFVVHGKFDWPRIREYAKKQNGVCKGGFCRVPGSEPRRWISFWPISSEVMALASSPHESAASDIGPREHPEGEKPNRPIWISVPPGSISESKALPAGAQSFTSPLASAERVVFSIGADGDRMKLFLEVTNPTDAGAADLLVKLQNATEMLNKMLAREKVVPNEADLSGLLSAGSFRREGRRVHGEWPLHRKLIESIAGGRAS